MTHPDASTARNVLFQVGGKDLARCARVYPNRVHILLNLLRNETNKENLIKGATDICDGIKDDSLLRWLLGLGTPHIDEALKAIDKMTLELVKHISAWMPGVYFKGYTREMFEALEDAGYFTLSLYRLFDFLKEHASGFSLNCLKEMAASDLLFSPPDTSFFNAFFHTLDDTPKEKIFMSFSGFLSEMNACLTKRRAEYRIKYQDTHFPDPPFPGNEHIRPVTRVLDLLELDGRFQTALFSVVPNILWGMDYVYHMRQPEDCLVILSGYSVSGKVREPWTHPGWYTNGMFSKVKAETRQAAEAWAMTWLENDAHST